MQDAETLLSDLGQTAQREIGDAKQKLARAADQIGQEARSATRSFSTLAEEEINRRLVEFGRNASVLTQGLRQNADQMEGTGALLLTEVVERLDDALARIEPGPQDAPGRPLSFVSGQFSRDNPGLFLLGCLAAGLLAGRMLGVTPPPGDGDDHYARSNMDMDEGFNPEDRFGDEGEDRPEMP